MSRINRRAFLETSTKVVGASIVGGFVGGCRETGEAAEGSPAGSTVAWRYAICNEIMTEKDQWPWDQQCRRASEIGYEGLEVAPFTLASHVDDLSSAKREELRATAEASGLEILGLHWLLVSPEGLHATTPDAALRRETWDYVAKLGDFCADLGGKVMIFGSPNQRNTLGISREQAMDHFAEGCAQVADRLSERNVTLLIEPLSSDQTDVINTLGEAMRVVEQVNHPAISTMFDFHNTADESEPLDILVRTYFDHIGHIQIQEMDGTYMGSGPAATEFLPAMRAFRDLGYDGWVSLEVFTFDPGAEFIATESLKTLKRMEGRL